LGLLEHAERGAEPRYKTRPTCTWADFDAACVAGAAAVVAAHQLEAEHLERLRMLRERQTGTAVILVTSFDEQNVVRLSTVVVDDVVFVHQLASKLLTSVQRATDDSHCRTLAAAILAGEHLDPVVRRAVSAALASPQAVRTVSDLAGLGFCSRDTLYRHWKGLALSPADFMDWLFILTAARLGRTGEMDRDCRRTRCSGDQTPQGGPAAARLYAAWASGPRARGCARLPEGLRVAPGPGSRFGGFDKSSQRYDIIALCGVMSGGHYRSPSPGVHRSGPPTP
jgi:hypothetical protein